VKKKKILVVDIGGTNVKVMISRSQRRKFDSGPGMTAKQLVSKLKQAVRGWKFDAVSIGFPSPVRHGQILKDPKHLGKGWVGFDFARALKKPVHVVNDAAMQALGSYHGGGRMLFLGLGTGLGSALVYPKTLLPLELGDLPYFDGGISENYLGKPGLAKLGEPAWKREVKRAVRQLKKAFIADYVVLGGGNAKRFKTLPAEIELGHNRNAYIGGVRLWDIDPHTRKTKWRII
jgi:hypothetical protein